MTNDELEKYHYQQGNIELAMLYEKAADLDTAVKLLEAITIYGVTAETAIHVYDFLNARRM